MCRWVDVIQVWVSSRWFLDLWQPWWYWVILHFWQLQHRFFWFQIREKIKPLVLFQPLLLEIPPLNLGKSDENLICCLKQFLYILSINRKMWINYLFTTLNSLSPALMEDFKIPFNLFVTQMYQFALQPVAKGCLSCLLVAFEGKR